MKCLLAPAFVVAALALASCGSSSTLSSDQFNGLQSQGKQFATSVQNLGADASSCAAAGRDANTPPDVTIVKVCLADALGKLQAGLTKIIDYTNNLSGEVDGSCSSELKTFSGSVTALKATLGTAEAQARDGDLAEMQTTLKSIKSTAVTSAGAAAERACKS
jgi:hypothetical protein